MRSDYQRSAIGYQRLALTSSQIRVFFGSKWFCRKELASVFDLQFVATKLHGFWLTMAMQSLHWLHGKQEWRGTCSHDDSDL